ncbi:MAG: hypothetical protein Aurels2KO_45540 [Aureliella sp.]
MFGDVSSAAGKSDALIVIAAKKAQSRRLFEAISLLTAAVPKQVCGKVVNHDNHFCA